MKKRGYVFRRGRGFCVRWRHGEAVTVRVLRAADGSPITSRREADKAAAVLLRPYALQDEAALRGALVAQLDTTQTEIERMEAEVRPGLPLRAGWDAYKAARNRPDTGAPTMAQYEHLYNVFTRWLGEKHPAIVRLNQIGPEIAAAFIEHLEGEGRAPRTVNGYANFLNLLFRVLAGPGKIALNPWTKDLIVRKRLPSGTGRRELTLPELRVLTDKAEGELRLLLGVGLFTGLRLGDAARLDWSEVDLQHNVIVATPRKTRDTSGAMVAIPIADPLRRLLDVTPERQRSGPVLPAIARQYTEHPRKLSLRIQEHFTSCGIVTTQPVPGRKWPRVIAGFHSLRHGFITFASMAGWPEALVRRIVGHTSGAVTKRYIHVGLESVRSLPQIPDVLAEKKHKALPVREPLPDWARSIIEKTTARTLTRDRATLLGEPVGT